MRNWTENQINLILIRHGATPSNALGRYLGRTEEDLSDIGKEKLLRNKEAGKYPKADIIFSSPMKRCRQTAELLYEEQSPVLIEEWREMDFGRFEGKNYQELKGDAQYQAWMDSNGVLPFPEGESREEFALRCRRGLQKALEELTTEEKSVLTTAAAVIHGGSIMALLGTCCGGDYFDYRCENGEGYVCRVKLAKHQEPILEIIRRL